MTLQNVLIAGQWRPAKSSGTFRAENPATRELLPAEFPVSTWDDCDAALSAAADAFEELGRLPAEKLAAFLEAFATRIEARADEIVQLASQETALPVTPRLAGNELPRTTAQLRQAAAAAREGSWALPTIDTKANIRSQLAGIGPVAVFGPNNFPLAFNSASGGDFAAAIAAGSPVIAKANSSHPGTTRLLAEEAFAAVQATGLPAATVQLLYRTSHADGDYLELSSVNPVVILPGALDERLDAIAADFSTSCLMGTGQFCTNPGLVILLSGPQTEKFIGQLVEKFTAAPVGTLLSASVAKSLAYGIATLTASGAKVLAGGTAGGGKGHSHANTLLRASGKDFIAAPEKLQTEAFGNASLLVVCDDLAEATRVIQHLEGNLTGCIYSHTGTADEAAYAKIAPALRSKVGRLLNDKMPTGVAVSPAMNHGGPYPATGHPGFTAVGIPASLRRFGMLQCYDGVRPGRLPPLLADKNPTGSTWRLVDGVWTTADVKPA